MYKSRDDECLDADRKRRHATQLKPNRNPKSWKQKNNYMSETKTMSETKEIIQDNLDYTLFSWSKQKNIAPIAVKYGEGVYLYDYDGKRYIDFSSGLMNVNIGHGNQRVTEAVAKQMQEVSYVTPSSVTKARGELGKKL